VQGGHIVGLRVLEDTKAECGIKQKVGASVEESIQGLCLGKRLRPSMDMMMRDDAADVERKDGGQ
jgi:hypothetical protein